MSRIAQKVSISSSRILPTVTTSNNRSKHFQEHNVRRLRMEGLRHVHGPPPLRAHIKPEPTLHYLMDQAIALNELAKKRRLEEARRIGEERAWKMEMEMEMKSQKK